MDFYIYIYKYLQNNSFYSIKWNSSNNSIKLLSLTWVKGQVLVHTHSGITMLLIFHRVWKILLVFPLWQISLIYHAFHKIHPTMVNVLKLSLISWFGISCLNKYKYKKKQEKTNFALISANWRSITWVDGHIKKRIKPAEADSSSAVSINNVPAKSKPVT